MLHDFARVGFFLVDAAFAAIGAWLLVCRSRHQDSGVLEAAIAWLLAFVALIVGTAIILGECGGFGARGFALSHLAVVIGLVMLGRKSLRQDWIALVSLMRLNRQYWRGRGPDRIAAAACVLVAVALTAIAAWAQPAVSDALTYHLPRIGHWLQERRIEIIPTADERMNFVAAVPEMMMAWLLGCTAEGFRLVVVAQAIGGLLTLGATIGLARLTGLSRTAAALSALLLIGMANVVVQFTAAQTDLFTTGVFSAAFFLWLRALRRGEVSILGAGGAGLALGAKGTLFYLAPGAAIWVLWLGSQYRLSSRRWLATLVVGAVGIAWFAGPGFVRNWRAYGNALGPEKWVTKHHQGFASSRALLHKLEWNLTTALAQDLEPHSQPRAWQPLARAAAARLARDLPERDPYTLDATDRREILDTVLGRDKPDADALSFGLPALLLFVLGTALAVSRARAAEARLVLVWSAGVIAFVVFFHGMQQWHPFGFRYLVLAAPWVAVVAAWGLETLPRLARVTAWTLALVAAGDVAWCVTTRTHQAGWRTVVEPERSTEFFVAQSWREWSQQLDRPDLPLVLAVSDTRPVAAFYRQMPRRQVQYATAPAAENASAEEFAGRHAGWVIVPAARFVGREGQTAASVWLFQGDAANAHSLAAYRSLRPGERPPPIIYRNVVTDGSSERIRELVVKTWSGEPVRFTVTNPDSFEWRFEVRTPVERFEGRLGARESTSLVLRVPAEAVSSVVFRFSTSPGAAVPGAVPRVELAPSATTSNTRD